MEPSEHILAEERYNSGRLSILQSAGSRSSATVVDYCGHLLEKPSVRAVADIVNILI